MSLNQEKPAIKRKYCLISLLGFFLIILGGKAFSQTQPSQPPPPPPSPVEVFNKINPFKKNKKTKDSVKKTDTAKINPAGPPPPPNPLNLFKKKKKDTTKASTSVQKTKSV